MPNHDVAPGDCFNSIAKKFGFYNYRTVFNHGDNAKLCGDPTNPNMLIEGKTVKVPDKRVKKLQAILDEVNKFVIDRRVTKVRVIVVDYDEKPCKVTTCKLKVGGVDVTKPDGFSGLIETEVDPADQDGKLSVKIPAPPPKVVQPVPPSTAPPPEFPPNPPPIVATHFTDKMAELDDKPTDIEWTLKVGFLEPVTEVRGGIQRLNNLGCKTPDPVATKIEGKETERVVKSFQNYKKKAKTDQTGKISDIQNDLTTGHDKA